MATRENDPYPNHNFLLDLGGREAGFSEVGRISTEVQPVEYRAGNDKVRFKRKLPGLQTVTSVTLRRGVTKDLTLWNWFMEVARGGTTRMSGSIHLRDETGGNVRTYKFFEAWPSKFESADLNAGGNEVAIEVLEITCERIEVEVAG